MAHAPKFEPGPNAPTPSRMRQRVSTALLVVLVFLQATPAVRMLLQGRDVPLPMAIGAANFFVVSTLLSLLDAFLPDNQSIRARTVATALPAVGAGGTVGVLLWTGVVPRVAKQFSGVDTPVDSALGSFLLGTVFSVFVVGGWSLAVLVPRMIEQQQLKTLEVATLKLEAAELQAKAELTRLRSQLEPHFLLNTLNMIAGLVGSDTQAARRTLVNLGALLRDALEEHEEQQSVDDEIAWLQRYCEVLSIRHAPLLRFEWHIDDAARDALLPRLILQPLVENAIVHGALRAEGNGCVTVRVRREGAWQVVCSIEDNGPGAAVPPRKGAIGVENVRRRLEISQPGSSFEILHGAEGTRAVIKLHYSSAEDSSSQDSSSQAGAPS